MKRSAAGSIDGHNNTPNKRQSVSTSVEKPANETALPDGDQPDTEPDSYGLDSQSTFGDNAQPMATNMQAECKALTTTPADIPNTDDDVKNVDVTQPANGANETALPDGDQPDTEPDSYGLDSQSTFGDDHVQPMVTYMQAECKALKTTPADIPNTNDDVKNVVPTDVTQPANETGSLPNDQTGSHLSKQMSTT